MAAKEKKSSYISYALRFGIAGAALYLAFRGENLKEIGTVLLGLNLWVFVVAIGIYFGAQLIFVFRWSLLLRAQSIKIGFWPAVRLHFLGLFYNNCLPSSVGGDLLRAWYVTKHTDKKLEAALSVFVDRVVGLTGTLIMAFSCYWFVPVEGQQSRFAFPYEINVLERLGEYKFVFIAILGVFVVAILALVLSAKGKSLLQRWSRLIKEHGVVIARKVHAAIVIYCTKPLTIIYALLLTFCLQGVCVMAMWLIGRQIGITAAMKYYFIFFPVSWLLGALPISVGGAGVMELWLKDIFMRVCGVSSKHALVLAFCQRLLWLFGSLPGAVIHLFGAHLPKDFSIDYDKSMN
ncbi:MAG: flippase-like domain-containing protein [Planctomycetes bacterium]|nr:flippase-like domain-containing protein [Planctomycetota bacterium]